MIQVISINDHKIGQMGSLPSALVNLWRKATTLTK